MAITSAFQADDAGSIPAPTYPPLAQSGRADNLEVVGARFEASVADHL